MPAVAGDSVAGFCQQPINWYPNAGTRYVVPANQSLIVTAVDISAQSANIAAASGHPECNSGREDGVLVETGGGTAWEMVNNSSPTHFTYPSGLVFAPGSKLEVYSAFYNPTLVYTCGTDAILLSGYLSAN
jgi:hypothetical protein